MNKSQIRQIQILCEMHKLGGYEVNIAQSISFLIRAARTAKSRATLLEYADFFNVRNHPSFLI